MSNLCSLCRSRLLGSVALPVPDRAFDRYAAIAHYDWYTKKATNRAVVLVLFGSFALTFIITASPFWTGFQSVAHCTVNLTHMHWVLVWNLLLGIALHIRIFFSSRAAIRKDGNSDSIVLISDYSLLVGNEFRILFEW